MPGAHPSAMQHFQLFTANRFAGVARPDPWVTGDHPLHTFLLTLQTVHSPLGGQIWCRAEAVAVVDEEGQAGCEASELSIP